jgi:hypothetical protein
MSIDLGDFGNMNQFENYDPNSPLIIEEPKNCIVRAKLHPMLAEVSQDSASSGETVAQIIERLCAKNNIKQWYCHKVYVELNGVPLLPALYERTKVKSSDMVVIQFNIPEGGQGKNPLRTILMVVITVVAIVAQQYWALGAWGTLGVAVVAGGAMMAVNALLPIKPLSDTGLGHESSEKSNIYSISGMRNQATPYQPLPILLGKFRYAPPWGALPYTKNEGNDQYLVVDLVWGAGPVEFDDKLKIGETYYDQYSHITSATNSGYATDTELGLYPNKVFPEEFNVTLEYNTPVVRTTQLECKQAIIEIGFQSLFKINANGDRVAASVTHTFSYRETGESTWIPHTVLNTNEKAAYILRKTVVINFFSVGQYDIQIVRDTPETDDQTYDEAILTEIKSVNFKDPVAFSIPVAETQMVIKASEELSGVVDNVNGVLWRICLDYDYTTDTWILRKTNSPASLYRYVYQGAGLAKPLVDSKIDLTALKEWHNFCRINGFTYNKLFDAQTGVRNAIDEICYAGRAFFVMKDDLHSVKIEKKDTLGPVQIFTPTNSRNFGLKKTFNDEIHGYRISFNNEATDYLEDEVIVYTQGYNPTNAYLFEAVEMPGVTNIDQVIHLAKYHLAVRRYRSELYTWEAIDWEHLVCSRGDVVDIANECILVSLASGRVKSVDIVNKTIVLDREISVQEQTDYGIEVRTAPVGTQYPQIFAFEVYAGFPEWTTDTFTWTGNLPYAISKGDIYSIGELGKETIRVVVTSKKPTKNIGATLTGVQYSWNEIELYMAGEFPVLNTGTSTPVFVPNDSPPIPVIYAFATGTQSAILNPDGTVTNRIVLTITIPSGYRIKVESVQTQILTNDGWKDSLTTDPTKPIVFENVGAGDHQIRIRSVSPIGQTSAWLYKTITQVDGTPKPSGLISLSVEGNLFQNDLRWTLPADYRDNYRIAIYCSAGLNDRSNTGPPIAILSGGTKWSHTGLSPDVEYYYWARIYIATVGSRETTLDTSLGWEDPDGSWQDESGQWDGVPNVSIGGWSDELGYWTDEHGNSYGGIDPYSDPKFSDWYPLNRFGGVKASPISDNAKILDMLTESIGRGQLVSELNTVIDGAIEGINYQQQFLENAWTVKIQEIGGRPYMVGIGLVLYPDWKEGGEYVVDQYVWKDEEDNVYKCKADHTSSLENQPPIQTYWELIPYGKKSGVAIVADQFSVTTADGTGEVTPFVISGSIVGIDGTLIVNGTVRANALSATDIYVVNLQSANYVAGVSGYRINSVTGAAEFNNITFQFNSTHVDQITTVINGTTISGTQISTPSISAISANLGNITAGQINFGSFIGYAWPGGTGGGAHLSAAGLLMGNPSTGQYVQLTAAGQLFLPSLASSGGSTTFAGVLSGPIVKALNIEANILTVREIYGLARINGNRLNVIATGSVSYGIGGSATITHNLGRFAIVSWFGGQHTKAGLSNNTVNSFTFNYLPEQNEGGITFSYAYM